MNPLEELKQKLMVKPTVQERERVEVVIKGVKPPKSKVPKKDIQKTKTNQQDITQKQPEEGKEVEESEEAEESKEGEDKTPQP